MNGNGGLNQTYCNNILFFKYFLGVVCYKNKLRAKRKSIEQSISVGTDNEK